MTTMGVNYITVDEYELRENKYLQRCRIYDQQSNPMSMSYQYLMDEREVREARREFSYRYGYGSLGYDRASTQPYIQQYQLAYETVYTTTTKPVEKKKEEKASKQIRHQYLRKRIKERIKI